MVGIATYLRAMIDESLMQSVVDSHKLDARFFVVEDSFQSVGLLDLICQDIDLIVLADALLEVVDQQFEVLVEGRLQITTVKNDSGTERRIFEIDASTVELMGAGAPVANSASSSSNADIVKFSNEEFADELIGEDEIPF